MSASLSWIDFSFAHLPLESHPADTEGRGTLSEIIERGVRRALFAGVLNPGDHIGTEASIAQAVGVSRMAARDALRALVAQGIVTVRKGTAGGARIATGDSALFSDALAVQLRLMGVSLADLLDAQIALESTAAELVAGLAGAGDVTELRAALFRANAAVGKTDVFINEIGEFHLSLARLSNNTVIGALLGAILQVLRDSYGRRNTPARASSVLRSYGSLIDAIEANDPDAARVLMRGHLRKVKSDMLTVTETVHEQPG